MSQKNVSDLSTPELEAEISQMKRLVPRLKNELDAALRKSERFNVEVAKQLNFLHRNRIDDRSALEAAQRAAMPPAQQAEERRQALAEAKNRLRDLTKELEKRSAEKS